MSSSSSSKENTPPSLSAFSVMMASGGTYTKVKKSHSKGQSGRYCHASPYRKNKGAASGNAWIYWLLEHRETDVYRRLMGNLQEIRDRCADPDPDHIGCQLTDSHGSDHRRTSTEAYRQMIDAHGDIANQIPVRVSLHVLALIDAGKGPPNLTCPRHPTSNKQAFWVASHLCHNKSCTNSDHLVWEPNWSNRQRDGCIATTCVHRPYRCIRNHRRVEQNIDWSALIVNEN